MPRKKKETPAQGLPLSEVFAQEAAEETPEPEAPEAQGDGYAPLPGWVEEPVELVRDFGGFRLLKDSAGRTVKQYREE